MPFTLIKGTFHVAGFSPDGDSIRFRPQNPMLVTSLAGPPETQSRPRLKKGLCQLRIEAIDTLETHYESVHQPLGPARAAADFLMRFVGITNVVWDPNNETRVLSATDGTPGYILSRAVEKNQRPVSFVFRGETPEPDGADVKLLPAQLRESYNYAALAEGHAYPTYYEGLFVDLRDTLTQAVAQARAAARGVWAADKTQAGVVADLKTITDIDPILPKLFRRLSSYLVKTGTAVGFKQAMALEPDAVHDLRTKNFTHLDTFVVEKQAGGTIIISLTRLPEELVFDEMPEKPTKAFNAMLDAAPVLPVTAPGDPEAADAGAEALEPAV